jgi:hypothetical protein
MGRRYVFDVFFHIQIFIFSGLIINRSATTNNFYKQKIIGRKYPPMSPYHKWRYYLHSFHTSNQRTMMLHTSHIRLRFGFGLRRYRSLLLLSFFLYIRHYYRSLARSKIHESLAETFIYKPNCSWWMVGRFHLLKVPYRSSAGEWFKPK